MRKIVFAEALGRLQARNEALIGLYREGARRLPPGPAGNLAASMAEQRRDLSKALSSLAEGPEGRAEVELDDSFAAPEPGGPLPLDAAGLLGLIKEAEDADFERLSDLSGASLRISPEAAELLASEAGVAKKRASWARDHLDLLGLSKP